MADYCMTESHRINLEEKRTDNKIYILNKRAVIEFSKWMTENDYKRTTIRSYCYAINTMMGEKHELGVKRIKKFLGND